MPRRTPCGDINTDPDGGCIECFWFQKAFSWFVGLFRGGSEKLIRNTQQRAALKYQQTAEIGKVYQETVASGGDPGSVEVSFQQAEQELKVEAISAVVEVAQDGTNMALTLYTPFYSPGTIATFQYTRSTLQFGRYMHYGYKVGIDDGVNYFKEFVLPSGRRIDFLDVKNGIIYELKPFNPNAIKQGQRQLQKYLLELQTMPRFEGIQWRTTLNVY